MEGTIIGQYRIVRKIGAGGMGAVYLAEHTLVGRRAAIKVLLPEFSVRRAIVSRFFNEARAMTAVPDPGIVQMYDFGFHTDGAAYIVMEMLDGETLERRRKRLRRLEVVDALRVTRQVAGSLAAAHAAGVIHRDLKPENIFIVRDPEALGGERPKVLDFGIAKLSGDVEVGQTMAGTMMGTPAYMSPEQCRGAGHVDGRSDVYSLSCVLAYLLTGQPPFDRAGMGEMISAHINDVPAAPSKLAPNVPAELDDLVMRCLAKSPDDRFHTMLELQAACDRLLARLSSRDVPIAPPIPTAELEPPATSNPTTLSSAAGVTDPSVSPPRRVGLWVGAGAVVVAAGVAVIVVISGGKKIVPVGPTAPASHAVAPPVVAVDAAPAIVATTVDAAAEPPAVIDAPVVPAATKRRPRARTPNAATPGEDDLYDDR
ncbi:MAG TPA: protein kinase [Kofleriaceae bacterium]|nr:protein kinase [Kofleriaceae bacterium]